MPLALALVLVVAVGVTGCSKKKGAVGPGTSSPTTTEPDRGGPIALNVTGVEPNGTPPPGDDVVAQVRTNLERYIALALVAPLRSGRPPGDLSLVLTPAAAARLDGPDRGALVEEGLPAVERVRGETANVALSSLAGFDGAPAVIAARLDLRLRATGRDLDVVVVREGEMVMVNDGDDWKIDGYQLRASREPAGGR